MPQILRHFAAIIYDAQLATKIDDLIEIPFGSKEEPKFELVL
jgi:hypothetical protein